MQEIFIRSLLVVLIGIYAIRSSWFIFSGIFSPLTPVATGVLVLCIILFHRPPTEPGTWLYIVIFGSIAGAIVNGLLIFSSKATYSNPTNQVFSVISLVGWLILAIIYSSVLINPASKV
jgi:ABC-type polysaccharide/polyol phosphate export permease